MRARSWIATLSLLALAPATAGAQAPECDPSQGELERAVSLFERGTEAVQAFRWSDAVPLFQEAYELTCRSSALYNLAMALRALGRHREARDTFDELIQNHPDLDPSLRTEVTQLRREEGERVAVLELAGIDPGARPDITLDGQERADDGTRPLLIETDAGAHSLVARVPEREPFLWDGRLADGQRQRIDVVFQEIVGGGGFDPTGLIIGLVAAALVGAAIGIGVFVWEDMQIQPNHPDRLVRVESM